jgi:hypothetical protein
MTMPTAEQMQITTEIAAQTLADAFGISIIDALTNHKDEIFHLVCAFAAQTQAAA